MATVGFKGLMLLFRAVSMFCFSYNSKCATGFSHINMTGGWCFGKIWLAAGALWRPIRSLQGKRCANSI